MQAITEVEVLIILDQETIAIIDHEVVHTIVEVTIIIEEGFLLITIEEQEPQRIQEELDHPIVAHILDQDLIPLTEVTLDPTEEALEAVQEREVILDQEAEAAEAPDPTEAAVVDLVEVVDPDLAVVVEEEAVVEEEVKTFFKISKKNKFIRFR